MRKYFVFEKQYNVMLLNESIFDLLHYPHEIFNRDAFIRTELLWLARVIHFLYLNAHFLAFFNTHFFLKLGAFRIFLMDLPNDNIEFPIVNFLPLTFENLFQVIFCYIPLIIRIKMMECKF